MLYFLNQEYVFFNAMLQIPAFIASTSVKLMHTNKRLEPYQYVHKVLTQKYSV